MRKNNEKSDKRENATNKNRKVSQDKERHILDKDKHKNAKRK